MTAAMVTVRMLQRMAGEHLTLEPADLYQTAPAHATIRADNEVAELIKPAPAARAKGATDG